MKIAFIITEVAGIHKVGGLGDVGSALPQALASMGHDIRICLPISESVKNNSVLNWQLHDSCDIMYASLPRHVEIYRTTLPQSTVPVYGFFEQTLISASHVSDAARYACWSLAVLAWLGEKSQWIPDQLHVHDWHAALIPLLKNQFSKLLSCQTTFTIHNANFQGETHDPIAQELSLDPRQYSSLKLQGANYNFNFMIQGIVHANCVNTVSPQYAKEIMTQEYGAGIAHIFKMHKQKLVGILNGIDTDFWNPETDSYIPHHFGIETMQEGKQKNKGALQEQLGLEKDPNAKLLIYIGRADAAQKGLQLVLELVNRYQLLSDRRIQLVILTKGDPWLEAQVQNLSQNTQCAYRIEFNEALAHQLYAAADISLIPSKYEPCGLIQMISMRYGTIPIGRATGGLLDSIQDFTNGFLFQDYTVEAFRTKIEQVINLPLSQLDQIAKTGMECDWSWKKSSQLYEKILKNSPQLTTSSNFPNIDVA